MAIEAPSPVRGRALTLINSASTPATVDYPADVSADDELVLVVAIDSAQTITASGWTQLDQTQHPTAGDTGAVFRRTAAGTEGGTTFQVGFTTTSRDFVAIVYSVDATGSAEADVATGSSANPDPPSLTPSGGAGQYLVFAAGLADANSVPRNGWPSGYGGWIANEAIGSVSAFSSEQLQTGTTFDPGTFTLHTAEEWIAWTIAVPVTMAAGNFPVVETVAQSTWNSAATSQSMNLPAGIASGDLLLAEFGTIGDTDPAITGWTELLNNSNGNETGAVLYKEADGTESGTVTVGFGVSTVGTAACRRISGADPAKIEGAISVAVASTVLSPPSLTPASGSDEVAWVVGFTSDSTVGTPLVFPFNYASAPVYVFRDSGTYTGMSMIEAASVTPPNGALEGARRHIVWTVAVYPTAAPPPDAPTNPAAAAQSDSVIQVTWDDVANETGYRVERSLNGSSGWTDVSGNLAADTVSYDDTGLTAETQYFYRVIAFNANGDSSPSSTVNATTSAASSGNRMGGTGAIRRSPRTPR